MKIYSDLVNKISFLYLLVPLFIFGGCWLRPIYSVLFVGVLLYVLYKILKDKYLRKNAISTGLGYLSLIILLAFLWCYIAGIGGFFWQHLVDWPWRNAIIHDLINFKYPVVYESNNTALVYYFGYFLPYGVFGKLISVITESRQFAFLMSGGFEILWSTLGIVLLFLQLLSITKVKNWKMMPVVIMFIFFSGMDIFMRRYMPFDFHIDWHPPICLFSNMYLLLMSHHIAIPVWLVTALFFQYHKRLEYSGILGVLYMFYLPQALFVIILFLFGDICYKFYKYSKNKRFHLWLIRLFDKRNILICMCIVPVLYFFFKSNFTSSNEVFFFHFFNKYSVKCIFCEVGMYLLFLIFKYYRDYVFYILMFSLLFFPYVGYKTPYDFCMRVTVPLLVLLFIYIVKFLFDGKKKLWWCKCAIFLVYIIGVLTPVDLISNTFMCRSRFRIPIIKDDIKTFENKINFIRNDSDTINDYKNYGAIDLKTHFFWKYMAKRNFKVEEY